MRPTFRKAPAPAIPTTIVENTSGAMMDLIRLRKMSRRKKTASPQSGRNQPITPPTSSPIMICTVSDGRYHGRRAIVGVIRVVINIKARRETTRVLIWGAHASRVLVLAFRQNDLLNKARESGTLSPARETRALPGSFAATR